MRGVLFIYLIFVFIFIYAVNPGDVLITEFMADPLNSDDTVGEYFELYNLTNSNIDITGWYYGDNGGERVELSGTIPAKGFFVIGKPNAPSFYNVDLEINMVLANTSDEIIIWDGDPDNGANIITEVSYNDGNAYGSGVALELKTTDGHTNGILGDSDFTSATNQMENGDYGSPKSFGNTPVKDWYFY